MKYSALCTSEDCYKEVIEDDVERYEDGRIYERSLKCWDCRTKQDRMAIKRFRSKHRSKSPLQDNNNINSPRV